MTSHSSRCRPAVWMARLNLHRSIEDMARAYVEEIRALRPHGPYFLAGYSGGGVVAFEMAQQLKALGEEVPLLVFFDTYHPQMPIRAVSLEP